MARPSKTIVLPAGTRLGDENMGSVLRSDAIIICDERDEWLLCAALKLPSAVQRLSSLDSQSDERLSKPDQAASLPVMSTTKSSSLESRCVSNQSRTCFGECGVTTIQVVVNLRQ